MPRSVRRPGAFANDERPATSRATEVPAAQRSSQSSSVPHGEPSMLGGPYGVAFAAKPAAKSATKPVPLWVMFNAVQWLDVVWSVLVLLGIEKLRIVPGFTQANALDLYYMPYTHSLAGAAALSLLFGGVVAMAYGKRAATFGIVSAAA